MERTEIKGKDVILHKDMSSEEREKKIERLRKESEALKEWEEEQHPAMPFSQKVSAPRDTVQRNYLTDDILIAIKYFLNDRKIPHLFMDYSSGSIPLEDLLTRGQRVIAQLNLSRE